MAKGDKFYFDNFSEITELTKKAALYLVKCLENYTTDNVEIMLKNMHEIENNADKKKHEMNAALAKAFVTPVDREDLDMLSHTLDGVIDKIEEILQKIYIYNIKKISPAVIVFARHIVKSCELLCELMDEFKNFKRSKKIHDIIIELNDAEEECDTLYLMSVHEATKNPEDVFATLSLVKIYDCFEACADACEHVGECVRTVVMKNT
ncbi:MAG: DUF47 family protein [Clostridia bacterium]|nr:DUF47 family protein [Clostridia bacterium]